MVNRRKHKPKVIYCIVDRKGWAQHRNFLDLIKYLNPSLYKLKLLTTKEFKLLWNLGLLHKRYIFFSSWRIPHLLIKENPNIFKNPDFQYFMAAVTSHSNIGGGLHPTNATAPRDPKEAFDLAANLLKKFRVVSVNSMILHELLNGALPDLLYCPIGVDTDFFTPEEKKDYNPSCIRIGWVGSVRGPKNFAVVEEACRQLKSLGGFKARFIKVPKGFKKAPLSFKDMRGYYRNIDFYLCASWNEGTPNTALEAGACGIPIVTTRVGNMRELIRPDENGFFVEPTVESVVSRFRDIRRIDKERYHRMIGNIRDSVAPDWSWRKIAGNHVSAFNRLVNT